MRTDSCPLYKSVNEQAPWRDPSGSHAGLWFDKFANAWQSDPKSTFAFDKGNREAGRGGKEVEGKWIRNFAGRAAFPQELLEEFRDRQRQLVEIMGGRILYVKNTSRFVTGLGREHPLENGFAWHHTLGSPYLPGSSLKGMLSSWVRENSEDWDWENDSWKPGSRAIRWFGTNAQVGQFVLLDMLPTQPPKLEVDIMTPHYGPYYQQGQVPGDWFSPVPLAFLTVASSCSWQMGIVPQGRTDNSPEEDLEHLVDALRKAIETSGAGAKTAVGYGQFEFDEATEARVKLEAERRREAEEQARLEADRQAAFEASLVNDSEPLRDLKILRLQQKWVIEPGDRNMVSALEAFASEQSEPPQDALDWIRELLESMPKYKGVWEDPEATKGKGKGKPKFSSAKIRELVKKLNPNL